MGEFTQVSIEISDKLKDLAFDAGLLMVGVVALVWIIGQKKTAKEKLIAVVQGLALAVLGPIVYKWFFVGLEGIGGTLALAMGG